MKCWKLFTATLAVSRWIKSEGKLEAKILLCRADRGVVGSGTAGKESK